MARSTFTAEVLTPEGAVFKGDVEMVSTRTSVGSIGILADHEPLLGMLDPSELRLYRSDTDIIRFAQGEGYVQVTEDHVLILVEEALGVDELDPADLRERVAAAEQQLAAAEAGSEQARVAERDKRRAEAFLAIASE